VGQRRSSTPGTHCRCGCAIVGVEEVPIDVDLPFGLHPGRSFRVQAFAASPADRLVFVTDGMLERNAAHLDVAATLWPDR
jgi:hypothetical protein